MVEHKTVRDALNSIKHLPYVLIGHDVSSARNYKELVIFTTELDAVIACMGCERFGTTGQSKIRTTAGSKVSPPVHYWIRHLNVTVMIYTKGKGLFPERFENELLSRRVMENDNYVPDYDTNFWATLYSVLVHNGLLSVSQRRPLLYRLKERMGSAFPKPRIPDIGFYPTESSIQNAIANL